jgi:transposase
LAGTGRARRCGAGAQAVRASAKPLPDWSHVHAELRRRSVTLALLWQDYRGQHPDGYG